MEEQNELSVEEIKNNLLQDNIMGLTITDKVELMSLTGQSLIDRMSSLYLMYNETIKKIDALMKKELNGK